MSTRLAAPPRIQWVGVKEATNVLGMSAKRLRAHSGDGGIPCIRTTGNCRRYDLSVLHQIAAVGLSKWLAEYWIQRTPTNMTPQPSLSAVLNLNPMDAQPAVIETRSTTTASFVVADDGRSMYGGFGVLDRSDDGNPRSYKQAPVPSAANLRTDAATRAHVESIAVIIDPFVWSPEMLKASDELRAEATRSYLRMFTALLAGHVTIDFAAFAAVIPVRDCDVLCAPVVPGADAIYPHGPLGRWNNQRRINLQESSDCAVYLSTATRALVDLANGYDGRVWLLTGMVSIAQINERMTGAPVAGSWAGFQRVCPDPSVEGKVDKRLATRDGLWLIEIERAIAQRRRTLKLDPDVPALLQYEASAPELTRVVESARQHLRTTLNLRVMKPLDGPVPMDTQTLAIKDLDGAELHLLYQLTPFGAPN